MKNIKPLAFYLPQYHPVPENDEWWGKGFTEWTNVAKAKPLFDGHEQPLLPADLGFYDLRVPEVREQQAKMAKENGVYGFIYYHYWFGNGKQILERIAKEVLESKKPHFPFCFCWANETWSGIWHGLSEKILAEQVYPNEEDLLAHFNYLLSFFQDERYIKVDNKPVLIIYDALDLESKENTYLEKFETLAIKNGFEGLYYIASNKTDDVIDYKSLGYSGKISNAFQKTWQPHEKEYISQNKYYIRRIKGILGLGENPKKQTKKVKIKDIRSIVHNLKFVNSNVSTFPMVISGWDNTPRSGNNGVILNNNSPEVFHEQLEKAKSFLNKNNTDDKFLILKSWNEWAEGNILEPDSKNGFAYLQQIKKIL